MAVEAHSMRCLQLLFASIIYLPKENYCNTLFLTLGGVRLADTRMPQVMVAWPVSTYVNNPANNVARCIAQVT